MASELEDKFQTLHEIVRAARMNLAPGPWDYLVGGTETETTLPVSYTHLTLPTIYSV